MDENKNRANFDTILGKSKECSAIVNQACDFFVQIPKRLQTSLKAHLKKSLKNDLKYDGVKPLTLMEKKSCISLEVELDKQLQAWKENPNWIDPPPEIKVSVPKGSLCNLNLKFKAGLPPDAIYNIVTDPDNRRVFKNIKEVISRKVLIDEGLRQVVEVEQAALWRFLWWSGTISVHVLVDQNRNDHTVKFTQVKSGFMKRFEGCWKVDPFFVDEQICFPYRPKTLADYDACTGGKGRVGSIVSLDQLIQPALVPPPPISWYLRGITTKTTEMLINDLLAEAARLRGADGDSESMQWLQESNDSANESLAYNVNYIKQRWHQRRILRRKRRSHSIIGKSNSPSSANPMREKPIIQDNLYKSSRSPVTD